MKDAEQRKAAKEFAERWKDKGYEKGESQKYWIDLLENVLGVNNAVDFIRFEDTVHIDKATGFIDGFIDKTKVLIEQKSIERDLRKAIKQSDGSLLNPFQQAKRYSAELPYDNRPRWIITCNFKSFLVYDMNNPNGEPEEILLKDLNKEYYRLSFLIDSKNEHIKKEEELSFKAGELVGKLYDAFSKQYRDLQNEQSQKDLNELCVRLVFCLYAEDAGLFGRKNVFHDYLDKYVDLNAMRKALIELFKVLDTPIDKRDPYLEDDLNQFPYVNGGLFSNENIEIPSFTDEIRNILLSKASDDFDWSQISPTIFGAVFESTLNPETRRSGGMHYTSIENIHKVIDPLFLNGLRDMLNDAESYKNEKTRNEKLVEFQNYISSLSFLDPACGSGNFLTETYLSLRRLENEALQVMEGRQIVLGEARNPIRVSISQFYGIEINDFAVKVAKTALWIAEAQMFNETINLVSTSSKIDDFLPLETYENIKEGNALCMDWNEVIPNNKCSYIMGNPPFIGAAMMSEKQKNEAVSVYGNIKLSNSIDYVGAWYFKASEMMMENSKIKASFVSTNSICQGEQVSALWKPLFEKYSIHIDFAYKTFVWDSEANIKAHVWCVIIGFSKIPNDKKMIFDNGKYTIVKNINPYLIDAPNVFVESIGRPICNIPMLTKGNQPSDGGGLILSEEEKNSYIEKYPELEKYIHLFIGAKEFLYSEKRYCFWLVDAPPELLKNNPILHERLMKVREMRLASSAKPTRDKASVPHLFFSMPQPKTEYIMIPRVTSSNRRYIPIGFMPADVIASDNSSILPSNSLYHFGVLSSNVHMSWVRTVCGRLGNGYRYSAAVVYNNFPWPKPTKEQINKIEGTAQMILDARKDYQSSSLADLYDDLTMPVNLRKAHQENDKAVMEAYGFNWRNMTETECVAELMKMYQEIVNKQ